MLKQDKPCKNQWNLKKTAQTHKKQIETPKKIENAKLIFSWGKNTHTKNNMCARSLESILERWDAFLERWDETAQNAGMYF